MAGFFSKLFGKKKVQPSTTGTIQQSRLSSAPQQKYVSLNEYIDFINGITIIEWNASRDKVESEPKYSKYFVGGVFTLYQLALMQATGKAAEQLRNLLTYYKTLYVLAMDKGCVGLCDYICSITKEMVIAAATDIKEYLTKNVNCFGENAQGLSKICFDNLLLASLGTKSIDRALWETALKETYELYRMIEAQDHKSSGIQPGTVKIETNEEEPAKSDNADGGLASLEKEFAQAVMSSRSAPIGDASHAWKWVLERIEHFRKCGFDKKKLIPLEANVLLYMTDYYAEHFDEFYAATRSMLPMTMVVGSVQKKDSDKALKILRPCLLYLENHPEEYEKGQLCFLDEQEERLFKKEFPERDASKRTSEDYTIIILIYCQLLGRKLNPEVNEVEEWRAERKKYLEIAARISPCNVNVWRAIASNEPNRTDITDIMARALRYAHSKQELGQIYGQMAAIYAISKPQLGQALCDLSEKYGEKPVLARFLLSKNKEDQSNWDTSVDYVKSQGIQVGLSEIFDNENLPKEEDSKPNMPSNPPQKTNDSDGSSKSILDGFDEVTVIDKFKYKDFDNIRSIRLHKRITGLGMQTFRYCRDLEWIDVDTDNPFFSSIDGVLFNKSQTKLLCYPAGKTGINYIVPDSVVSIEDFAFASSRLVHIQLSKNLRRIGDCGFEGCSRLKEIVFPETLEEIGYVAFQGCSSINMLNIPANLENITFPALPKNLDCITVDEGNKEFASEDGVLFSKDKTVLYRFPGARVAREYIVPETVHELAGDAFGCCKIQRIVVPDTVTKIGQFCFSFMQNEQTVYVPEMLLTTSADVIKSLSKATFMSTAEYTSTTSTGSSIADTKGSTDNKVKLSDAEIKNIEELVNKNYPGIAIFVRDVNLKDGLAEKYRPGMIIREKAFTDASNRVMGMVTSHRYMILSNHMANISAFEHGTNWGLCIGQRDSHFKVLGTHKVGEKTAIILLHLPDNESWKFFIDHEINIDQQLLQQAKTRFEAKCNTTPIPELTTKEWLDRCSFPLGMDKEGNLWDL